MKLKKLIIYGFKSFAEKISIDFDYDLIAIVGPNGCGKSNIADAFRWALGEQSAKSLRGDQMQDFLFAGSESRKASNYAEVSLIFSDIDKDFLLPYEELTITRRLHRTGESEYFINKEEARLRDVQSLFLGSGIGKNAFSIFEQGKLDQIIHLSPIERRTIFDEAAGTSRFLLRKKESLRKLATVNENFVRVRDLHTEIEKQTRQLKKQALHATAYKENKNRLEQLEKNWLQVCWQKLVHKEQGHRSRLSIVSEVIEKELITFHSLEKAYQEVKERVTHEKLQAKHDYKTMNQWETKASVLESELKQYTFHVLELKNREESLNKQLEESCKQSNSLQAALLNEKENVHKAAIAKEKLQKEVELQKGRFLDIEANFATGHDLLKKNQKHYLNCVKEESTFNAQWQQRTLQYEHKKTRFFAMREIEERYCGEKKHITTTIEEQQRQIQALSEKIDELKERHQEAAKTLQALRMEENEGHKERERYLKEMTELEGHYKALHRLKENMEGLAPGVKSLLQEAKNKKSPLYQKVEPLFEYLVPLKGFESLLASAMRSYLETVVVASEEDLHLVTSYAQSKKISDFSVLIKGEIKPIAMNESSSIPYCEPNPIAYFMTSSLKILSENHFEDALGVRFYVGASKKNNSSFIRHSELLSLSKNLNVMKEQFNKQTEKNALCAEALKQAEKIRSECFENLRKKEMDLVQINFFLQRSLAEKERIQQEWDSLLKEKERMDTLAEEEKVLEQLQEQKLTKQKELNHLSALIQEQESANALQQDVLQQEKKKLEQMDSLLKQAYLDWYKWEQEMISKEGKLQHIVGDEKKLAIQKEHLLLEREERNHKIANHEKEIHAARHHYTTLQHHINRQEHQIVEAERNMEMLEKEIGQKRKILLGPEKERHALELTLAQVISEKEKVEREWSEKWAFHSTDSFLSHPLLELNEEEISQEIGRLRVTLEEAGAVNMAAIEDFQTTQERFHFLDQQLNDLDGAKKDLEEMITTLEQESRKIFKKMFFQIREHFQKNFALLFQGGAADITFTDSSDILEAGIEITAKPPGKQMKAISLLSGGEKCLTALALLFSIFEVRPAPFCILDEVDAPLDDSNIERFTEMLKQFIDKTQFIMITHNKKTMAIANLLLGISMEEKGVSKLISLAFEKRQLQN